MTGAAVARPQTAVSSAPQIAPRSDLTQTAVRIAPQIAPRADPQAGPEPEPMLRSS
ncbi:hypothetical protein [Streptomyces sp. NPDC001774]